MTGFPLLTIFPTLLERIITKVGTKSYFRLQQSCHEVNDFIHGSSNISVPLSGGSFYLTSSFEIITLDKVIGPLEVLYGIRLNNLCVYEGAAIADICMALSKNRVTCKMLDMKHMNREIWTKEQCLALLKILKPVEVEMSSWKSDRYEALCHVKTIKMVDVDMDPNDFNAAVKQMFSTIPKITMSLPSTTSIPYSILRSVLQLLTSDEFPSLKQFTLCLSGRGNVPSPDEFLGKFQAIPLTIRDMGTESMIWAAVHLPPERSQEFICNVFIDDGFRAGVVYRRMS